MSVLAGGESRFRDDDGSAGPLTAAALAAFGTGTGSEHAALTSLARSRLLVPVVAAASDDAAEGAGPDRPADCAAEARGDKPGGEKYSEMSLPTLVGRDGRRAVPAFTCLDALSRWRPGARPVPTAADDVWRAAVADSCAVVVDIAGPVPLAVDGARLAALARGEPVPLPHQDPDVLAAVRAAAGAQAAITGLSLAPGPTGTDLEVKISLAPGCAPAEASEMLSQLGAAVMTQLGERLRRGVALAVTPGQPSVAP